MTEIETRATLFAVKSMFPAEHIETANRLEWCQENNMEFFNVSIRGTKVGDVFYDEQEMQEIGVLELLDADGVKKGEINLETLPPINIGMGFVFHDETDAAAFKLQWN